MSNLIDTKIKGFKLRFAEEKDTSLILEFIKELAEYEKLLTNVVATEETLKDSLFVRETAHVLIAEYNNLPVGFAVYFYNFSTFLGLPGIYLEDLYIKPEMRGKGFGKTILAFLAKLTKEQNFGRLEWSVLDWNEPSIKFYKSLGAEPMDEWTVYRVTGNVLKDLAKQF